jgi:hypothetical protein
MSRKARCSSGSTPASKTMTRPGGSGPPAAPLLVAAKARQRNPWLNETPSPRLDDPTPRLAPGTHRPSRHDLTSLAGDSDPRASRPRPGRAGPRWRSARSLATCHPIRRAESRGRGERWGGHARTCDHRADPGPPSSLVVARERRAAATEDRSSPRALRRTGRYSAGSS